MKIFNKRFFWIFLSVIISCTVVLPYIRNHNQILFDRFRYTDLPPFDPQRTAFTCTHQAATAPLVDPQAELWFQQGMDLLKKNHTKYSADYSAMHWLWSRAARKKHWRAQQSLIITYLYGYGVPQSSEKAVQLIAEAMEWGEPAAWAIMANVHSFGLDGLAPDMLRAYAFRQKAADMGAAEAQSNLGENLMADENNPLHGIWNNKKIGMQMLECARSQGYASAANKIAFYYIQRNTDEEKMRGLPYLQDAVRMGSESSALALASIFDSGTKDNMLQMPKDSERARRYQLLSETLTFFPALRFPHLDNILPLPPAPLPSWSGSRQQLLAAAMVAGAIVPETLPAAVTTDEASTALPRLNPVQLLAAMIAWNRNNNIISAGPPWPDVGE